MADGPALTAALRDSDAEVRSSAERSLWLVWSRSGDPAVDRRFLQGVEQMQRQELDDAIETFTDIIARKPEFAEGWNKRATAYYLAGELDRSLADCDEVMKRNPEHFGALSGYGMIYLQLGRPDRALGYFERALAVNPNLAGIEEAVQAIKRFLEQQRRGPRETRGVVRRDGHSPRRSAGSSGGDRVAERGDPATIGRFGRAVPGGRRGDGGSPIRPDRDPGDPARRHRRHGPRRESAGGRGADGPATGGDRVGRHGCARGGPTALRRPGGAAARVDAAFDRVLDRRDAAGDRRYRGHRQPRDPSCDRGGPRPQAVPHRAGVRRVGARAARGAR